MNTEPTPSLDTLRLLGPAETAARVALSVSTVRAMESAGLFPRAVPLTDSGSRVAWLESDVNQWIKDRVRRAAELGASIRAKSPNPRARVAS